MRNSKHTVIIITAILMLLVLLGPLWIELFGIAAFFAITALFIITTFIIMMVLVLRASKKGKKKLTCKAVGVYTGEYKEYYSRTRHHRGTYKKYRIRFMDENGIEHECWSTAGYGGFKNPEGKTAVLIYDPNNIENVRVINDGISGKFWIVFIVMMGIVFTGIVVVFGLILLFLVM